MFVTLFNLQGAHRSSAAGFYFTTSFRLCQELFSSFLNFFVPSSVAAVVCCCRNGFTSYHTFQTLSSTFFDFFQCPRFRLGSSFEQLDYLTTLGFVCQAPFSTFFSRPSLSLGALSSSLTILPHSVSFVKSFFRPFSADPRLRLGLFRAA